MDFVRKYQLAIFVVLSIIGAASMLGFLFGPVRFSFPVCLVLGLISIFSLGLRDVLLGSSKERARSESIEAVAKQLGYSYQDKASADFLGWSESFELTRHAVRVSKGIDPTTAFGKIAAIGVPKSVNIVKAEFDSFVVVLFDYEFSENDATYRKCVAAIASEQLGIPRFAMFPASIVTKLANKHSIFGQHRLVTENADLSSDSWEAIASWLDSDMNLEAGDGYMLLYRTSHRSIEPNEIETCMQEAQFVFALLCKQFEPSDSLV